MQAGSELDKLVAEKVMGFKERESIYYNDLDKSLTYFEDGYSLSFSYGWEPTPFNPSENIADAWLVVEKLRERLIMLDINPQPDCYKVYIEQVCEEKGFKNFGEVKEETAPFAICLAALKAVDNVNIVDKGR